MSQDRHSKADDVEFISDPLEKAQREAENGVRQFKAALKIVAEAITNAENPFRLNQRIIIQLHRAALEGIHPLAGTYRNSHVAIGLSKHQPPPHDEVADLVAQMCDYVNQNWEDRSPAHLAGYVLWRMNWIHPFADGNGRTARMVSYLVLCIRLKSILPGDPAIPDIISQDKQEYYRELEKADESWKNGSLAISSMELMIERLLERQLEKAVEAAGHP